MTLEASGLDIKHFQHELLNRISIVTAYCYLLREEKLSADQSEMVGEIDAAAAKAKDLILGLTGDDA